MSNEQVKICWDCAYLGKCEELKPCKRFKRYNYRIDSGVLLQRDAAKILGISLRRFASKKMKDKDELLKQLNKATGKTYVFYKEHGYQVERLIEVYDE